MSIHLVANAILQTLTTHLPEPVTLTVLNHPLNSTADEKTDEYLESGTDLTVGLE